MATTKLGNTSSGSRAINYAEKRAVVKSGLNCDINYAKSQMKSTRSLYGKEDGIQAHTIIQSFKPNEITAEKANEIGLELAEEVAENYQVAVYTHDDTDHIHNHIIISAINLENGRKYQSNAKQRHLVKGKNDEICLRHGLSIVKEKTKEVRYTLAERELLNKGQSSWKDDIRQAINLVKTDSQDFQTFESTLKDDFGIEMKLRGKTLSFKHPERERFVRANKLGYDYEKEALEHEFTRGHSKDEGWGNFERTLTESRSREEAKEHAVSERSPDGTNDTTKQIDGKNTDNIKWTAQQAREESERTSRKRKQRDKQKGGGLEL